MPPAPPASRCCDLGPAAGAAWPQRRATIDGDRFASSVARDRSATRRRVDLLAVAEHDGLRALSDAESCAWAESNQRRIVTEDVKDFAPLLRAAHQAGHHSLSALLTSARTFSRSRRRPGQLIEALDEWLSLDDEHRHPAEDWLAPPAR